MLFYFQTLINLGKQHILFSDLWAGVHGWERRHHLQTTVSQHPPMRFPHKWRNIKPTIPQCIAMWNPHGLSVATKHPQNHRECLCQKSRRSYFFLLPNLKPIISPIKRQTSKSKNTFVYIASVLFLLFCVLYASMITYQSEQAKRKVSNQIWYIFAITNANLYVLLSLSYVSYIEVSTWVSHGLYSNNKKSLSQEKLNPVVRKSLTSLQEVQYCHIHFS